MGQGDRIGAGVERGNMPGTAGTCGGDTGAEGRDFGGFGGTPVAFCLPLGGSRKEGSGAPWWSRCRWICPWWLLRGVQRPQVTLACPCPRCPCPCWPHPRPPPARCPRGLGTMMPAPRLHPGWPGTEVARGRGCGPTDVTHQAAPSNRAGRTHEGREAPEGSKPSSVPAPRKPCPQTGQKCHQSTDSHLQGLRKPGTAIRWPRRDGLPVTASPEWPLWDGLARTAVG